MKTVYLTSGPRGAGKSTFVEILAGKYPQISVISRDKILKELFGQTSLNPYLGGHSLASEKMFDLLKKRLSAKGEKEIILDCWNGHSFERKILIKTVKALGASRVVCWQFRLPVNLCVKWFFEKPDSRGYSESGIRNDYALYYSEAENIDSDGFDLICRIDPGKEIIDFKALGLHEHIF